MRRGLRTARGRVLPPGATTAATGRRADGTRLPEPAIVVAGRRRRHERSRRGPGRRRPRRRAGRARLRVRATASSRPDERRSRRSAATPASSNSPTARRDRGAPSCRCAPCRPHRCAPGTRSPCGRAAPSRDRAARSRRTRASTARPPAARSARRPSARSARRRPRPPEAESRWHSCAISCPESSGEAQTALAPIPGSASALHALTTLSPQSASTSTPWAASSRSSPRLPHTAFAPAADTSASISAS